jgi:hypothetical protein
MRTSASPSANPAAKATPAGRPFTRGHAAALGLVAVVFTMLIVGARTKSASEPSLPSVHAQPAPGDVLRVDGIYAVSLDMTTRGAPLGGDSESFVGHTLFAGVLEIGMSDSAFSLRAREVDEAKARVNDVETIPDDVRARFHEGALFVARDAHMARAVSTTDDMPLAAARMWQLVLAELLVESAPTFARERTEYLTWGTLHTVHEAPTCVNARCTRTGTPARVSAIHGIVLDDDAPPEVSGEVKSTFITRADGARVLATLARRIDVRVVEDGARTRYAQEIVLVVERIDDVEPDGALVVNARFSDARRVARALDVIETTADADVRMLDQRIDGLTRADFSRALDDARASGAAPDHNRFLWRATGLMAREPALVKEIEGRYAAAPSDAHPYRALLLDLLVGTGDENAQRALVTLLARRETLLDEKPTLLFQRLALLQAPTDDTIAFARVHAQDASSPYQLAAWITLGAAARTTSDRSPEGARGLVSELANLRRGASTVHARTAALLALGNSGHPAATGPVVEDASAPDANIRHAVAEALGKLLDDEARTMLVSLSTDKSPAVSRRALNSLRAHTLDASVFGQLAERVQTRAVPDEALADAVTLASTHFRDQPNARALLESVLSLDHVEDRHVQARVRQMLAR